MAFTTSVRNVSPVGDVSAYLDGQYRTVPAGATIDVTPEAAGESPRWRVFDLGDDQRAPELLDQAGHYRVHAGKLEVWDRGSGLLAQPDNWLPAGDDPAGERPDPAAGSIPLVPVAEVARTILAAASGGDPTAAAVAMASPAIGGTTATPVSVDETGAVPGGATPSRPAPAGTPTTGTEASE